jgi:hypothetical protein
VVLAPIHRKRFATPRLPRQFLDEKNKVMME